MERKRRQHPAQAAALPTAKTVREQSGQTGGGVADSCLARSNSWWADLLIKCIECLQMKRRMSAAKPHLQPEDGKMEIFASDFKNHVQPANEKSTR